VSLIQAVNRFRSARRDRCHQVHQGFEAFPVAQPTESAMKRGFLYDFFSDLTF